MRWSSPANATPCLHRCSARWRRAGVINQGREEGLIHERSCCQEFVVAHSSDPTVRWPVLCRVRETEGHKAERKPYSPCTLDDDTTLLILMLEPRCQAVSGEYLQHWRHLASRCH